MISFKLFSFSRRNLLHGVKKNLSYVRYVDLKTMTDCTISIASNEGRLLACDRSKLMP